MREAGFWDSSALVPLCLDQASAERAKNHIQQYEPIVWWAASVEVHSAFARLRRMNQISAEQLSNAYHRLDALRPDWQEVEPSSSLRELAEELPSRYGLRAADALQLAAALTWTMHRPHGRPFLSGDQRLLDAARQLGFRTIEI